MKVIFSVLLTLPFLDASSKFPIFKIKGTLKCYGEPIKGEIIMYDSNFAFTDHLLTERHVGTDGKFSLLGEPADDCLNVKLTVIHKCHNMKTGRGDNTKLTGYSEFSIRLEDLIKSDYELQYDIELSRERARISSPVIPAWKAWLYGKRMMTDLLAHIKKLDIWKIA
uniref:Transthyretin-like family protein n=1 Tax=Caenorhabditis tropicalis TaxID=1561998 RepID=A0A1I7U6H4_9PELO